MLVVYALVLGALFGAPALRWVLRRLAFRTVSWTASRIMRQAASRAPYSISYELSDSLLSARVEKLGISRSLDLREVAVAIASPGFICVFRSPDKQTPERILYVPRPEEQMALEAALRKAGAQFVEEKAQL